jgi:hypothetical protein
MWVPDDECAAHVLAAYGLAVNSFAAEYYEWCCGLLEIAKNMTRWWADVGYLDIKQHVEDSLAYFRWHAQ